MPATQEALPRWPAALTGAGTAAGRWPGSPTDPPDVVFPDEDEDERAAVHLPVLPDELQRVLPEQRGGGAQAPRPSRAGRLTATGEEALHGKAGHSPALESTALRAGALRPCKRASTSMDTCGGTPSQPETLLFETIRAPGTPGSFFVHVAW